MKKAPSRTAVLGVVDTMSDDELAEWLAAGDYRSIGDVKLPKRLARTFTALTSEPEVEGFVFDPTSSTPLDPANTSADKGKTGGSVRQMFLHFEFKLVAVKSVG